MTRGKNKIAIAVFFNPLPVLLGVIMKNLNETLFHSKDFLSLNMNIGSLSFKSPKRLMKNHTRIGQSQTFSCCTSSKKNSRHTGSLSDSNRGDVGSYKL